MSAASPDILRRYARPMALGLVLAGLLVSAYIFVVLAPQVQTFGYDAFAYWNVSSSDPYAVPIGGLGSFNYTPPIAFVFDWFGTLEWWVFLWLWTALLVANAVWLGWSPLGVLVVLALPFVALDLYHGNIHLLLAVAIVLGFRHPWTWTFVLLTKPSAAVGLLWFVVHRDWRSLAVAVLPAVVLGSITLVLAPQLWFEWLDYVFASADEVDAGRTFIPLPLWIRLPLSALIVVWGALTERRWTVIVGSALALPVLWFAGLAMLAGLVPERRARSQAGAQPTGQS